MPNWTGKDYGAFAPLTMDLGVKIPKALSQRNADLLPRDHIAIR